MAYSIAIDGPAGSGKSTVATIIAKKIDFEYVNSGALYRTVGLYLSQNKIDYLDEKNIDTDILKAININWTPDLIFLNDVDVTAAIRAPEISNIASQIAVFGKVRDFVNKLIHKLSKHHNIVVDGRDIGSVVLPDATLKVFLDAGIKVRAIRIFKMNVTLNISKPLAEIEQDVATRDDRDYKRAIAPLIKAKDAILIDSSNQTVEQIVEQIETLLKARI